VFARFSGFYMDVDEDVQSVVAKTGDEQVRSGYLHSAGIHASSSESAVFSKTLGSAAISTADVMRDAMQRGAAILKIDASNVGRLDELARVSASVKQEITRAVNERGATVTIPESETTIGGWTGVGYIIDEGSTIQYRIAGGQNGAVATFLIEHAVSAWHNFTLAVTEGELDCATIASVLEVVGLGTLIVAGLFSVGSWLVALALTLLIIAMLIHIAESLGLCDYIDPRDAPGRR
jgi:hypothetical protein